YSSQTITRLGAADDKGEFAVYDLDPNQYFISSRLPNDNWYLKSIVASTTPVSAASAKIATRSSAVSDLARTGVTVKAGEKFTGISITVGVGAASLKGKIVAAKEGTQVPSRIRVHLVPAEASAADIVLRYVEAITSSDGSFEFNNIPPGRYLLQARAVPDDETADRPPLPVALDSAERAKLRKEAEARKIEIELSACQNMKDQIIRW